MIFRLSELKEEMELFIFFNSGGEKAGRIVNIKIVGECRLVAGNQWRLVEEMGLEDCIFLTATNRVLTIS